MAAPCAFSQVSEWDRRVNDRAERGARSLVDVGFPEFPSEIERRFASNVGEFTEQTMGWARR